jgi:hypothetical protein
MMTEKEWLAATDPWPMLDLLRDRGHADERRCRLFACSCVRRAWHILGDDRERQAVEVAEQYADGLASRRRLTAANSAAMAAGMTPARGEVRWPQPGESLRPEHAVLQAGGAAIHASSPMGRRNYQALKASYDACSAADFAAFAIAIMSSDAAAPAWERAVQVRMARCIFGNIYHESPPVSPALLAWSGGTVRRLVKAAYRERDLPAGTLDPALLAVLADALEDAGCQDPQILGHLRGEGPHVRGCWCVDLLLGRR